MWRRAGSAVAQGWAGATTPFGTTTIGGLTKSVSRDVASFAELGVRRRGRDGRGDRSCSRGGRHDDDRDISRTAVRQDVERAAGDAERLGASRALPSPSPTLNVAPDGRTAAKSTTSSAASGPASTTLEGVDVRGSPIVAWFGRHLVALTERSATGSARRRHPDSDRSSSGGRFAPGRVPRTVNV